MNYKIPHRCLIKISGEALKGKKNDLYDYAHLQLIAKQLIRLAKEGIQVAVVIGGGNIWRGSSAASIGMDRVNGDFMGMLATVMNALALESVIKMLGYEKVAVCSTLEVRRIAEPYYHKKVHQKLNRNYIMILSAGLGHPYFTTDTAASLRAIEIDADILLMGKNSVSGIYTKNPHIESSAKHLPKVSLSELINLKLDVMDKTASTVALDGNMDMIVFDINKPDGIYEAVHGLGKITLVQGK